MSEYAVHSDNPFITFPVFTGSKRRLNEQKQSCLCTCVNISLRYHSTETALVKVANDILLNMNSQRVTLLVLLDLSAAFDTVDHAILLKRLTTDFGIGGKTLEWFSSYLSGRSQRVLFEGATSGCFELPFGVPQGSCLGPLLFVVYASKLFEIVQVHLPNAHCFADDTQLYLSFNPNSPTDQVKALEAMERCISDLRKWVYRGQIKDQR